ncbi:MAG: hypothetical protein KDK78_02195, partial [Chlamydiia bacterium]|nr:hypothetical protein [Chlamydiia bacterium]
RVYGGEERDAIMAPVHQSMRQLRQLSETLCDMIQAYVEANCKRVAIHGDGSCLFRSITRGLDRPETEHFKLRKAILKYLGEHLDKYALTIEDVIATEYANAVSAEMRRVKTVRDYLQHMQRSTSYGDRPEILAAAEIFQAAIVTVHTIGYGADKRYNVHEIVIPSELSPKRPVIFLNHTGAQHYNVLLPDLEKLTENVKLRKEQEEEQAELSCEEVDDIV